MTPETQEAQHRETQLMKTQLHKASDFLQNNWPALMAELQQIKSSVSKTEFEKRFAEQFQKTTRDIGGRVNEKLGQFGTMVVGVKDNVAGLENKVGDLDNAMKALRGEVGDLDNATKALRGEVSDLDNAMKALRGEVSALDGRFERLDNQFKTLNDQVKGLGESVTTVNRSLNNILSGIADIKLLIADQAKSHAALERRVSELEAWQARCTLAHMPMAWPAQIPAD